VLASDQGALPLASGASTSAKQDTGNTSIASIDAKTPALVTGRIPVDGSAVTQPVSAASLPLPTGAARETGGNLAAILAALESGSSTALLAGELHIGSVSGQSALVSASYARPANTDYYTALDVFSNSTSAPALLSFTNIARVNAGSGYIVKARLVTDQASNASRFRLHLFHTAISPIADNSPFASLYANRANKIGFIDFDAMGAEGSGSDCAESSNFSTRLKFVCAAASRSLYGILEVRDNFTPTSGQSIFVELTAEID